MEISTHICSFGYALIGTYNNQVSSIEFGQDIDECYRNFINRWAGISTQTVENIKNTNLVDKVLNVIETGIYDPSVKIYLFGAGTHFQSKVWEAISTIEPGKTASYKDIAIQIGRPKAVRAIGTACGMNPIAVLIPCHRVIKSDGSEGGYRWGSNIKNQLLRREASLNK